MSTPDSRPRLWSLHHPPIRPAGCVRLLLSTLALLLLAIPARAQLPEPALSAAEVEILRDKAPDPPERILAFVDFLNDRTRAVDKLTTLKRRPGREQDIHDMMEQFTSIANDLDDNLDEYGKAHKDLRKVLPRLIAATERWSTALKSPPDHDAYNISRKLALEAVSDIHESAHALVESQKAWFLAHPPTKDQDLQPTLGKPSGRPF